MLINFNNKLFYTIAFLTGFAIVVSTALQSVTLILIPIIAVLNKETRINIKPAFKSPFVLLCFILYMFFIIRIFHSEAFSLSEITHMLIKMSIYLVCPLIFAYYSNKTYRQASILGFVVGALISLFASLLMFIFKKPFLSATYEGWACKIGDWAVFHYHTDHNYFLAILITGLISILLYYKHHISKTHQYIAYIIIALSFIDIFYLVQGRVGQVVCVLMLFLVFLLWSFKKGILIVILLSCLLPAVIYTSPAISCGIERTTSDVAQYKNGNQDTSVGARLEFHKYAKELIKQKPILGYGTGSFRTVYHNLTGYVGDEDPYHPHNDFYWLWVELGVVGPLLLIAISLSLIAYGLKYRTPEGNFAVILSLSYMAGAQEGGFYTDAITSAAFILIACILLSGSTLESLFKKK